MCSAMDFVNELKFPADAKGRCGFSLKEKTGRQHKCIYFEDSLRDSVLKMVLETLHVVKGAGPSLTPGGRPLASADHSLPPASGPGPAALTGRVLPHRVSKIVTGGREGQQPPVAEGEGPGGGDDLQVPHQSQDLHLRA